MKLMLQVLIVFLLSYTCKTVAQTTFFNQGQIIHVNQGGLLFVNGDMTQDGIDAELTNLGTVETQNSSVNGDFIIQNDATVQGLGEFYVEGDWTNNANFIADDVSNTSKVTLTGSSQLITGTEISTFYQLELGNSGSQKTMTLNSRVLDSLILNNNELYTQTNTMYVMNPDPQIITNNSTYLDEGYVSSDYGGRLARMMNTATFYVFPMGSSQGTERYRPVVLNPLNSTLDMAFVAMLNTDATADGFSTSDLDSTLCFVNKDYYHTINRLSGSATKFSIFYDAATDINTYDKIAQWNTPQSSVWNALTSSYPSLPVGNYTPVNISSWSDFSEKPFILGSEAADGPQIIAPLAMCSGQDSILFIAVGSQEPYLWSFPSTVDIVAGQGHDSIYVNWMGAAGLVSVSGDTAGLCRSKWSSVTPVFMNPVIANYSADTNVLEAGQLLHFYDESIGNVNTWNWTFLEGYESALQNPSHIYTSPGYYSVLLEVEDQNGCTDTVSSIFEVLEYVQFPNVFSPNRDGINDYYTIPFYVANGKYHLEIYSRWGELLFTSEHHQSSWDGRNLSGEPAPEGTYYYVFKGSSATKQYDRTGFLTLTR